MLQPSLCYIVFLTREPTHNQGVFQETIMKIFPKKKPEHKAYCLQTNKRQLSAQSSHSNEVVFCIYVSRKHSIDFHRKQISIRRQSSWYSWSLMNFINGCFGQKMWPPLPYKARCSSEKLSMKSFMLNVNLNKQNIQIKKIQQLPN